ncbi:hypothetical protein SAMN05216350_104131 [Polaromonas sp. YR568]|uniref:hypothetical protein n=1 Tax=Polaromonas sp. YR568 TaxID=1855301 RepID=UPI0008F15153|nr:hypothetical protein [Polaromonas sp. YR568]SFU71625.1 hypothetical protein SAMN05216350_104131 [Polaromonas sp. YR568]
MSFLNWFSGKSSQSPKFAANEGQRRAGATGRDRSSPASVPSRLPTEGATPAETGKLKRHARREQLYVAIREAMTRAGVLSASYKFKVLSLDQRGNEFIVMMDLAKAFNGQPEQLGEIETLIVQNARARFEITVPAVYWRMDEMIAVSKPAPLSAHDAAQPASQGNAAAPAPAKPPAPRYEPIQADEVAAFKQALLAASAEGPAVAPEKGVKVTSGPRSPRSYTLLTGFEDTEMPESNSPALSSTQYGDLI